MQFAVAYVPHHHQYQSHKTRINPDQPTTYYHCSSRTRAALEAGPSNTGREAAEQFATSGIRNLCYRYQGICAARGLGRSSKVNHYEISTTKKPNQVTRRSEPQCEGSGCSDHPSKRDHPEHVLEFPGARKLQQANETSLEQSRELSTSALFFTALPTLIDRLVYNPTKQTRKLSSLHTEGSRQAFPQQNVPTDPTREITLNPYLYSGSLDSTRSPPDESWSRGSSPGLEQAHPHIYPDERRSSVISFDSTVAPSSPQPASPESRRRERRPQATQADTVLLKFLAPDQPQVAIRAGESPLSWSTGSEGNNEIDMEGGAQDGDGGGGSKGNSQNESREQSTDQPGGSMGEESSEGSANGGEPGACGNGGGDERKGNSGGGKGGRGEGGDDHEDSKDLGKGKNSEKREKVKVKGKGRDKEKDEDEDEDMDQIRSIEIDNMDIDTVTADGPKGRDISKPENGAPPPAREGGPVEVELSSETAVSLMALAAGDDRQPFTPTTSLPGVPLRAGGTAWAPNARAKSPDTSQNCGPPPSPGPSTQLFQNNKLPLLNSPTQLPSMISSMNPQPASPPNGLPPGNDGRHTTLPPVSSIQVLADMAEKAMPPQSSTTWPNPPRMPQNPRIVYPTVSSHVSVAPSNRTPQPPRSPGLPAPPPGQSPHGGFGPEANHRPPVHHMTHQQKQFYLNQDPPSSPYYSNPHQHYQPQYPPMKEGASPNTNGPTVSYQSITHRELPGIIQNHSSPSSATTFFPPPPLSGRRDSATMEYYPAGNTPPSGPITGDTMPSPGTDDTITSPRSRSTVAPGAQGTLAGGGFKCEFAGCKASPFQTQYLLNSHANVHSSARPHYCPVKGCSRGEGGKGFKRKNEMIRHGLVHDSPGYVCPFCPDREHKYPRPDNLQRHVRVHHVDKDKDDPQLRDVLAQRPEGGNRGRRRRLGS
ncbi:unnamed protein product [Tuber aestivum]|uniref:C2H2-type domain-containing protein n=1 Tax=Tuber aestivum TaxID=59557 RepID=A0A292PLB7_9PEZI|nr:unnamed protein product [Tuber aestivum]